jgi:hypothetical protein
VDNTGSEEGKQPSEENGTPSQFSAGNDRAVHVRSEQEGTSESASRAFELLERFSGELEEILHSLERAKGNATATEDSPQAPEPAFSPSSIHFDPSSISARIDPDALPPIESPSTASRSALRLMLEAAFLILVAVISARSELRPLLIVVAEATAFLIVASVELAVARDRRLYRQLPASAPAFTLPPAQETGTTSEPLSVTLDQVEPLVWQADRQDAEVNWPLAPFVPPSEPDEAEGVEKVRENATEISTTPHFEGGVTAEPTPASEVESEEASEDGTVTPAAEPRSEAQPESSDADLAEAPEREHHRHFRQIHHEAVEPVGEPKAEIEAEPEVEPEIAASEPITAESESVLESTAEIAAQEISPEHRGHFRLFGREKKAPDVVVEPEAEVETEPETEAEPERGPEVELESAAEIAASEMEPGHHRRFGLLRHEADEPEAEVESEPEIEVGAPNDESAALESASQQNPAEKLGGSAGAGHTTIEIDLPPEIPIDEIERTLEDLGSREPRLHRRLRLRGASVEKEAREQPKNDDRPGSESQLRLVAEGERHRREREYLRNMRASR